MKNILIIFLMYSLISLNFNCRAVDNANKSQKGAGIGVLGGALAGALIGGNVKSAVIGAAVGGSAGAIIGKEMDKQAQKIEEVLPGAEVVRVGEGIQVVFDEQSGITFAFNSANLTNESKLNLDKIAKVFIEFPETEIFLGGHTDSVGNDNYNMTLSTNRALAVSKYLQEKGVDSNRIKVQGFGETAPKYDNSTKEGQAKNRRVEVGIAANEEMIEEAQAKQN